MTEMLLKVITQTIRPCWPIRNLEKTTTNRIAATGGPIRSHRKLVLLAVRSVLDLSGAS